LSRLTLALGLGLLAVEASAAVWLVSTSDHNDRKWATLALVLTTGITFVVSGLIALARRPENRTGVYLAAVGYLWFLTALTDANNAWLFTIGFAISSIVFVPFTALVLAYPTGRLATAVERAIPVTAGVLVTVSSVTILLFDSTPAESTCPECPESTIVITQRPGVGSVVDAATTVIGVGLIVLVVAILVRRWRRASPASRRLLWPVLVTSMATLIDLGAIVIADQFSDGSNSILELLFFASFATVPVAFLFGVLRSRIARTSVTDVVVALQEGTPLQDVLARALGDPSLEVRYWVEATHRWVDREGRTVDPPDPVPGRAVTTVARDEKPVGAILYDSSLEEETELVEALAAAAALSLHNERLQAELRAQYIFLETVANTAPSLLVVIDTDGRIQNQNAATVAASGFDDEEQVRGKLFWDVFIDPEERDDVVGRFEAARPDFEAAEYENTFTNRKGERLVIDWRSAPVQDESGTVVSIVAGGIDVTERHRHARELELERQFLNAIANNAPSLLCLVDVEGRVAHLATNIAFEQTLDYAPDETGGYIFWERYVDPDEADEVRGIVERVAAGETVAEHDNHWLTSSGKRLLIAWSATPLPQIDERKLLLISGVDVTERKHRELELQRERDATTTVLQTIPSVVVVLDRSFEIRDRDTDNPLAAVNRAFRERLSWHDQDLVGRSFVELIAEDDDGRARLALAAAASGQPSREIESDWLGADGERVSFAWSASPVADVTGRTDGLVLVSGVDITERKARELEAERRRGFLSAITEAIPSFLVAVDGDAMVIEHGLNRAFTEGFGWTQPELAGKSFLEIVASQDDHAARMAIANAANGVAQSERESRWLHRDGDSRLVAWTAWPVTDHRGRKLVLISGHDVTVRRRQDEEIRASRARLVEAADDARRKLERNLHDGAQQRLVALSVSLRLAEGKLRDDPDGAAAILAASREELTHALDELRELARGIHPAVLTDRGLGAALDALVSRSPIPVETELPETKLQPAVEAAAYYVVSESLANVVKYAQASSVRVRVATENGQVVVEVSDDGVGGADPAGGSGLRGLADRVAALDGSLSVVSPNGAGTCVRAVIPVRASAPTA
jgi:PAS domain S-box-containing protein